MKYYSMNSYYNRRDERNMPVRKIDKIIKQSLKMLVFGKPGVGKTHFYLTAPGRTLVFDSDNGTNFFAGKKGVNFDIWVDDNGLVTSSYKELMKCITYLSTPEGIKTYQNFAIDFTDDIWKHLQHERQEWKNKNIPDYKRKNKEGNEAVNEALDYSDWGAIKKLYDDLLREVKQLPQNIFLVCKEKAETKMNEKKELEKTGEFTFEGEKNTDYAVDFVVRLTEDDNGKHYATLYKDRSGTYERKAIIEDPTFELFKNIVEAMKDGDEYIGMGESLDNAFEEESLSSIVEDILRINKEISPKQPKIVETVMQKHLNGKGLSSLRGIAKAKALRDELALIPKDNVEPLDPELVEQLKKIAKEAGITSMDGILETRFLPYNPPVFVTNDVIREKLIPRAQEKLESVKNTKK